MALLSATVTDAVVLQDGAIASVTHSLTIANARALTGTSIRIDFSVQAVKNAALSQASNYVFSVESPGTFPVVPLSVTLPAGQQTPAYVEVQTTEHTLNGAYTVALAPALRGVNGETANAVPKYYIGNGTRPELVLVLATSPTTVEVHFSEAIAHEASAQDPDTYTWLGPPDLQTLAVKSIVGNVVTLETTEQVPGGPYLLMVQGG